jgi:hypothetical protein
LWGLWAPLESHATPRLHWKMRGLWLSLEMAWGLKALLESRASPRSHRRVEGLQLLLKIVWGSKALLESCVGLRLYLIMGDLWSSLEITWDPRTPLKSRVSPRGSWLSLEIAWGPWALLESCANLRLHWRFSIKDCVSWNDPFGVWRVMVGLVIDDHYVVSIGSSSRVLTICMGIAMTRDLWRDLTSVELKYLPEGYSA